MADLNIKNGRVAYVDDNGETVYEFPEKALNLDTILAAGDSSNRNIIVNNMTVNGTATAPTIAAASDNSTNIATTAFVQANVGASALPVGIIMPFAGSSAPTGYQFCNGQALDRSTFSNLFSAIGTTYGVGDGSSTFNVPDLRGRVIAGLDTMGSTTSQDRLTNQTGGIDGDTLGATGGDETHTLTAIQLPAHNHFVALGFSGTQSENTGSGIRTTGQGTGSGSNISTSNNTPNGQAHNNVQPTIILNYIIKT